jgi:hypothetical protein
LAHQLQHRHRWSGSPQARCEAGDDGFGGELTVDHRHVPGVPVGMSHNDLLGFAVIEDLVGGSLTERVEPLESINGDRESTIASWELARGRPGSDTISASACPTTRRRRPETRRSSLIV